MKLEIQLKVYADGEYSLDDGPNGNDPMVTVPVGMLVQRIRNMRTLCRDHDLANVSDWCYYPKWDMLHFDDTPVRSDCDMLHVTKDEFWFDTYIKHTAIRLSTEHTNVSKLKAMGI